MTKSQSIKLIDSCDNSGHIVQIQDSIQELYNQRNILNLKIDSLENSFNNFRLDTDSILKKLPTTRHIKQ